MSDTKRKLVIAVDGFSSTGKSTLAKDLARHYNIRYIDSGAMYRAVTYYSLINQIIDKANNSIDEKRLEKALDQLEIDFLVDAKGKTQKTLLNGEDVELFIRQMEVSSYVSYISKFAFVREKLVEMQRRFEKQGSLVMDGRDIGTVVFPNATVKFFVTADKEIRAQRRYDELKHKGVEVNMAEIKKNLEERDRIDQGRKVSPLKKAEDAVELDNSNLTREQQLKNAVETIENTV